MVMKKDFETIEHTADIGIRAHGIDLSQAFTNAARGMFSLITDLDDINEIYFRDVEIKAADREALLVEWLNNLLFLFDTEQLIFCRFHIESINEKQMKARCYGERVDKSRHDLKRGIKAATYYMLKVEKVNDYDYQVQVILDI
jgi:SHS2 domain-containing protein